MFDLELFWYPKFEVGPEIFDAIEGYIGLLNEEIYCHLGHTNGLTFWKQAKKIVELLIFLSDVKQFAANVTHKKKENRIEEHYFDLIENKSFQFFYPDLFQRK